MDREVTSTLLLSLAPGITPKTPLLSVWTSGHREVASVGKEGRCGLSPTAWW